MCREKNDVNSSSHETWRGSAIGIDTGQVITYNALLGPATVGVDQRC